MVKSDHMISVDSDSENVTDRGRCLITWRSRFSSSRMRCYRNEGHPGPCRALFIESALLHGTGSEPVDAQSKEGK